MGTIGVHDATKTRFDHDRKAVHLSADNFLSAILDGYEARLKESGGSE